MSKLLMISTDRKIFEKDSAVRQRQVEYAKKFDVIHIVVLENNKGRNSIDKISDNCFAYSTNSRNKVCAIFDAKKISKKIINDNGIESVTCQDPFFTGLVGVSLKKKYKVDLEIQIHTDIGSNNFAYNFGNKIRKIIAYRNIRYANKFRVVSKKIANWLKDRVDHNIPIEVRPIEINGDNISNSPVIINLHDKYRGFSKIILMASRLEEEKDISLAISAFSMVPRNINVGLIIVGSGSLKGNILNLINRLGLGDRIILEDWVNHDILYSYYKTADAFLNTSLFEGYGMTLMEAKYCNCKIISTDVGIANEIGAVIVEHNARSVYDGIIKTLDI